MRCDLRLKDPDYEVTIVGSGPNGLAAAILLAQHGLKVLVVEEAGSIGGSVRTGELTLPGFQHDKGAAIVPLAAASPFFKTLPLSSYGLKWIYPPAALAHPFDDGTAALLTMSIDATAKTLGEDSAAYIKLISPLKDKWDILLPDLMGTMRSLTHPLASTSLALKAFRPASHLAKKYFSGQRAKAFFAGLAAHSVLPLDTVPSAAIGIILCLSGHSVGWPIPAGGAGNITGALAQYLVSIGGRLTTAQSIKSLSDLPPTEAVFYDTSPRQIVNIYGDSLPAWYRKALQSYRYGPGVFKIDWALSEPIPWKAKECMLAATVHLGGTFSEIAEAEKSAWLGKVTDKPFVILVQPSLFDSSRAPVSKHTAWAYCHVPNGCSSDITGYIEAQVERFAPGFGGIVLARHISTPAELEKENPNLAGGDIVGGAQTLRQLFCRPVCSAVPYATPLRGVYLCSASTPPGAGVHGMCGYHAATAFLKRKRS